MIEAKNLCRYYETKSGLLRQTSSVKKAVEGASFRVEQGEIFGLLGPNGAGKTTTMKVMTTLLLPTSGQVSLFGLDVCKDTREIRRRINFIYGGERSLYGRLTAFENLRYFGDLYSLEPKKAKERLTELLELVGMSEFRDRKVETFSKGMKQRLQIARGLVNDPEILFMDEPTIGLDPAASKLLHEIILMLKEQGKTIVLTTHYMKEAEELCDRIAFINEGKLIGIGDTDHHKAEIQRLYGEEPKDLEEIYLAHFGEKRSVS